MAAFLSELFLSFLTALGVVLGGSLIGSLAAYFTGDLPLRSMRDLAEQLKFWGLLAALGGTFFTIRNIEVGLLEGQLSTAAKQLLLIAAAFAGAHLGFLIVQGLAGGEG